jgi:hypothetical protein
VARTDSRWVQSSFGIRRTISVSSRAISRSVSLCMTSRAEAFSASAS